MWSSRPEHCYRTAVTLQVVVVLLAVRPAHNLKCVTMDHSRRQGNFVDLAEQCKNMSRGDRSTGLVDSDYSFHHDNGGGNNNYNHNRRNGENNGGRKNINREFSVRRQDYGNNNNNGNDYNDHNNGNHGNNADDYNNRGNAGDHDSMSCNLQPRPYSGSNSGRPKINRQGNTYYPSVDYEMRQSNPNNRQPNTRRYRKVYNNRNNNNNRRRAAAATSNNRLLGNNRFRNVTKNGGSQVKGSILDKLDSCTIHCVFNQLEMLNSNSRPDKSSIVNIMTNQIKDVELKEFMQDSIDECFDTLELDSPTNNCEFSKNFAVCMENKAQKNCDDWDENLSANKMISGQDGNNQQDKIKG